MASNRAADEWMQMTFEEMAEQVSERVYDAAAEGISIYIGLEHLSADDLRIRSHKRADEVTYGTHGKLRLRPGQIVFGRRSANLRKLGVCQVDAVASEHAMILNERPSLAPGFLPFFMQSDIFMDRADEISEGSLSKTIKWATMAKQTFWVPPLEQQHELVELRQGFEAAIEAGEKVLEAAEQLNQTLSRKFMGDNSSRALPQGWSVSTLGPLCKTITSGGTPSRSNHDYFSGDIPWVKTGELNNGLLYDTEEHITLEAIEQSSAKIFPANTVLVAMYGATIGETAVLARPMSTNQACCAFIRDETKLDYNFLHRLLILNKYKLVSLGIGAGQPNISQGVLKSLEFIIPPLEEQKRMTVQMTAVSSTINSGSEELAQLKTLRSSVLNSILTPSTPALVTA